MTRNCVNYFLKDHLGSTTMVLDQNGSVKQALMYQPYGTVSDVQGINTASTDPLRQKFTTKEFDEDGGIDAYHFGARVYDPEIGVWFSCDKGGQFFNVYKYSDNPISTIDPDGNFFGSPKPLLFTGMIFGYVKHGIQSGNWGKESLKAGLWTGIALHLAMSKPTLGINVMVTMGTNQGITNIAQNKASGFFPNVGQFIMGTLEGTMDFGNMATAGIFNRPNSYLSGTIRGQAYNYAQGIYGEDAKNNRKEARQMNRMFGNYLGQGTIVKAASDYVWALEGGKYAIGWDERYKYAKAKRLYAEGGYTGTNASYTDYINSQNIDPDRIEMAPWHSPDKPDQGKWYPQFGHGLGGSLFSHKVWHQGFESYGEPYEEYNEQDYSDDWGLLQWLRNY